MLHLAPHQDAILQHTECKRVLGQTRHIALSDLAQAGQIEVVADVGHLAPARPFVSAALSAKGPDP